MKVKINTPIIGGILDAEIYSSVLCIVPIIEGLGVFRWLQITNMCERIQRDYFKEL